MKRPSAISSAAEEETGLGLSPEEHARVAQVARELAALMDLPDDPRILEAAYDIVRVFVVQGGMAVPLAIETMSKSLKLTLARLSERNVHH